ncbi:SulP family inorganic anion transporter [Leeia oryzae]|uniref:SulP family inorganic anion transporter n=1 Tax=Leeia oryzae TaxID=356662 RepID=UPI00035C87CA|nr:SulP family inorganic anion transporter [Leeia oryzae]
MKWPLPGWIRHYHARHLPHDAIASITLMVLLIPQGLAYALLAGMPPQAGLYASIFPALLYALAGSSATLSVGPAALPAMMTVITVSAVATPFTPAYFGLAAAVALLSGLLRLVLGVLRFGFMANLLSQPVVGGFIAGSAFMIILTQVPNLLGIPAHGDTAWLLLLDIARRLPMLSRDSLLLSLGAFVMVLLIRYGLQALLHALKTPASLGQLLVKTAPVIVMILATLVVRFGHLSVKTIGPLPQGWQGMALPDADWGLVLHMWPAILAIALLGFVDSFSIAQTLAIKRRENVSPDRELMALGLANMGAGLTGGFPVSASFGRSAANEMAGAKTQLAGVLAAFGMLAILLAGGNLFVYLPVCVLGVTIVMAVSQMLDGSLLKLSFRYDRRDAFVYLATLLMVLFIGVVQAILAGVVLSLALFIWRTSQPHLARLGRIPGTEHYRNVLRYQTETRPDILIIRVDENLYFANIRFVQASVIHFLRQHPKTRSLLLVLSSVNMLDVSALQGLQTLQAELQAQGVSLHLAEVKGPVMDKLQQSGFLDKLTGSVHLSIHAAVQALSHAEAPDFMI